MENVSGTDLNLTENLIAAEPCPAGLTQNISLQYVFVHQFVHESRVTLPEK